MTMLDDVIPCGLPRSHSWALTHMSLDVPIGTLVGDVRQLDVDSEAAEEDVRDDPEDSEAQLAAAVTVAAATPAESGTVADTEPAGAVAVPAPTPAPLGSASLDTSKPPPPASSVAGKEPASVKSVKFAGAVCTLAVALSAVGRVVEVEIVRSR
jgi:hypothetical protein